MKLLVDIDARYASNRPLVVSDTIEDETVILHHGTGRYFDTAGTGAFIWGELEAARSPRAIARDLVVRSGISVEIALAAVRSFFTELIDNDLISKQCGEGLAGPGSTTGPTTYSVPTLGVHTDLADMLLLDPIHDVGPTGWPRRPEEVPSVSRVDAA